MQYIITLSLLIMIYSSFMLYYNNTCICDSFTSLQKLLVMVHFTSKISEEDLNWYGISHIQSFIRENPLYSHFEVMFTSYFSVYTRTHVFMNPPASTHVRFA